MMRTVTTSHSLRRISRAVLLTLIALPAFAQTQNSTTSYQYDANGNVTQITDPLGHVTSQSYDALDRLKQQVLPAAASGAVRPTITPAYNGQSQTTGITDPRNLSTQYGVDGLGNLSSLTSPDTGNTGNTYDAQGNLKTSKDARGFITTFTYDALNRPTKIAYSNGTATSFEYDGGTSGTANVKGRLTKISDESGNTLFTYDTLGHLLSKKATIGSGSGAIILTTSYTYGTTGSATGKLTSLTYPSANRLNYSYDVNGRVNSITLNPTNTSGGGTNTTITTPLVSNISYSAFGAVQAWTWGNDTPTAANTYARSFDLDGRLTSYPLGNALANGLNRTLSYDAASRITGTTHTGSGTGNQTPANYDQTYTYDDLNRLIHLTTSYTDQAFQYDLNGNRTQTTLGSTSYTDSIASTSNQLSATTGPVPVKSNQYDAAGNLTTDGTVKYGYSARGRMSSATIGSDVIHYLYNGLGQRTKKSAPIAIISTGANGYAYDEAGHLLGEYNTSGKVLEETVYLGDLPVAVVKQTISGTTSNQVTTTSAYYVYADHINTPRVITRTSDNKMVWRWDHTDPFGLFQPDENPSALGVFSYNQRMPGQVFDKETMLFYNNARYYDPQLGRYITSDPIGLRGGINTYVYVEGNPISYADPFGLVRPQNPNSQECQDLRKKIQNKKADINKRIQECKANPNNLPYSPPYPGAPPRMSVQGHEGIIQDLKDFLKDDEALYREKCGGDGGGGDSPAPAPAPAPPIKVPAPPWWLPLLLPVAAGVLSQ